MISGLKVQRSNSLSNSQLYNAISLVKEKLNLPGIFDMHDMSLRTTTHMLTIIGISTSDYALKHPGVQQLIHSEDRQYDLILTEQFYQEAFLMLAHKFRTPIVSVCRYFAGIMLTKNSIDLLLYRYIRFGTLFQRYVWVVRSLGTCAARTNAVHGRNDIRTTCAQHLYGSVRYVHAFL